MLVMRSIKVQRAEILALDLFSSPFHLSDLGKPCLLSLNLIHQLRYLLILHFQTLIILLAPRSISSLSSSCFLQSSFCCMRLYAPCPSSAGILLTPFSRAPNIPLPVALITTAGSSNGKQLTMSPSFIFIYYSSYGIEPASYGRKEIQ